MLDPVVKSSRLARRRLVLAVGLVALVVARSTTGAALRNERFEVRLLERGAIEIMTHTGARREFQPHFTVFMTADDPGMALRWCQIPRSRLGVNAYGQEGLGHLPYNVVTWGRQAISPEVDRLRHVEDGFDPKVDRAYGEGRTANVYHSAPRATITATATSHSGNAIHWHFDDHPQFKLSATVRLAAGDAPPRLDWELMALADGYYSVGYVGAPQTSVEDVQALWQPMIWNERRFPGEPFLTQAFRCPLPTTLVTSSDVTTGVLADPAELPFMPMPTNKNSPFGVAVRNDRGAAQPTIFAPVLGGPKSLVEAGDRRTFSARLIVYPGDVLDAYLHIARNIYNFRDYRRNATCSLNTTLDNMIDYGMSKWSRFNEELRGCDYSTDAPGAVKNVSSLHPLSAALVTDNWEILRRRAWPMFEYAMSREKFLFTTNPEQKTQNASTNMTGPGAPLSELTALYQIFGRQADLFLSAAKRVYGQDKIFNLKAVTKGDRWQNALAMYRATGEDQWRERTIKLADDYLQRRCNAPPVDWTDPDAEGMFFWPSFVPQWIELLELYESIPDSRYLEAAHQGARAYAQFIWFCPQIPDGVVRVNQEGKAPRYRSGDRFEDIHLPPEDVPAWRLSEIGLTPESSATCKGHRGILNAHYAPSMLRLSQMTGDKFLHDVARSAIVGRYANFPGYHMNTARTTVYEKADFPLRPVSQLNAVTSMHFNHIWPHIALMIEYLAADAFAKSDGQIDFPSAYCEGYAYIQGKVFGHLPGQFYDDEQVWLWMPPGLVEVESVEVNYLVGRGNEKLYLAFTNQSPEPVATDVRLNSELAELSKVHAAELRRDNGRAKRIEVHSGQISVELTPGGITTLVIEDMAIQPQLQHLLGAAAGATETAWRGAANQQHVARLTGMVFSLGPALSSAYIYSRAPLGEFDRIDLHYRVDDDSWQVASDSSYPFEWTVPLGPSAERIEYYAEATAAGKTQRAKTVVLRKSADLPE